MSTIDTQREITKSTKAIRKDAVLVNEFIVTSDKGFFNNLSDVDQQLFFKTATDWFQERYGEQNVVFLRCIMTKSINDSDKNQGEIGPTSPAETRK